MNDRTNPSIADVIELGLIFLQTRDQCQADGVPFMAALTKQYGYSHMSINRMMRLAERIESTQIESIQQIPISTLYEWVAPSTSDDQLQLAINRFIAGDAPKQITADLKAARPASPRAKPKPAPEPTPVAPAPEPIEAEYRQVAQSTESLTFTPPYRADQKPTDAFTIERSAPAGSREYRIANEIRLAIADNKGFSFASVMDELRGMVGAVAAQRIASAFSDKLAKVAG